MRAWLRPAIWAAAGVLAVLVATAVTLGVSASGSSGDGADGTGAGGAGGNGAGGSGRVCERLAVPAYFSPPYWETAIHSKHPPADMILNVSGVGAGKAPVPEFQTLVKQARAAGITVLGYSSTNEGKRPAAQVETDVRDYAAWYGVTSIFLDRVSGQAPQVSYYRQLARYIHRAAHRGAQVWLNPGVYPNQSYLSIGDVVMVFEGTYAQYLTAPVPGWVKRYPADRFAHTIYATPGAVLAEALELAQQRNAKHVYVTDLVGSDPYQGLPSYWPTEDADANAACKGSG
jgi:hypothetical protein